MREFASQYAKFLDESPSPYHAVASLEQLFAAARFTKVDLQADFPNAPGGFYAEKNGAFAAWITPEQPVREFRIFGCHTDSPALMLKPVPQSQSPDGFGLLEVEVYGVPLINSWLDRELQIAGVVFTRNENAQGEPVAHLVSTPPVARIPQLAIHLDRQLNQQGLKLDLQQHVHPIWTLSRGTNPAISRDAHQAAAGEAANAVGKQSSTSILDYVAKHAGLSSAEEILAHELYLYPSEPARFFGDDNQFLAARRQDNLSSTFVGARALLASCGHVPDAIPMPLSGATTPFSGATAPASSATTTTPTPGSTASTQAVFCPVFVTFNHEEIGSSTTVGAGGPFLGNLLARICLSQNLKAEARQQVLERSFLISGDAGHSVHPNYPERADTNARPVLGQGPILKINADQRYATSGRTIARWNRLCETARVKSQVFVSNNNQPCGSTIGPISATRLGIDTVDVGIGLLSMHSTREMSHIADPYLFARVIATFWR